MDAVLYIGTKMLFATPMTRDEYNIYRGWSPPTDEDGNDAGFLVEYTDGGEANHPDHKGYISWLPADVFNAAYRPTHGMAFGAAVEALKIGQKVTRAGWNGKGMFLFLVPGSQFQVNRPPLLGIAHIDMKTAQNTVVPWLASQTDVLADDWQIVA